MAVPYAGFMFAVYTFVSLHIFKARWNDGDAPVARYNLYRFFAGIVTLGLLNEVLNCVSGLVAINVNYVKKVIFSEMLPVVFTASVLFNMLICVAVLLPVFFACSFSLNWTAIFLFPILLPLVFRALEWLGSWPHSAYFCVIPARPL